MRAIVCTKSGPPEVLQLQEVEKPIPDESEVLVKVHASTVTIGDVLLRKMLSPLLWVFSLFGVPRKKIAGHELAGEVEAVGGGVTRFKVGDEVYGTTTGLAYGSNAEYVCLPEEWKMGVLAPKPVNVSYEEAAAIPIGAMTAVDLFRKVEIKPGQTVLVYGASGSVGTYAVQVAKHFGAVVTGVCSAGNMELVRSLGANRVLNYTGPDWPPAGETYDVVFDAVRKLPSSQAKALLKEGGTRLTVASPTSEKTEHLLFLKELVEAGALKAVIDRRYPLEETAEAHRYVEDGHKRGNVVITI
jgi:alcohol dehydrogenase